MANLYPFLQGTLIKITEFIGFYFITVILFLFSRRLKACNSALQYRTNARFPAVENPFVQKQFTLIPLKTALLVKKGYQSPETHFISA